MLLPGIPSCNKIFKSSQDSIIRGDSQSPSSLGSADQGFISKKFLGVSCYQAHDKQEPQIIQQPDIQLITNSKGDFDDYLRGSEGHVYGMRMTRKRPYKDSSIEHPAWEPVFSCSLPKFNIVALNPNNALTNFGHYGGNYKIHCNYLAIRARISFPKINHDTLYISYPKFSSSNKGAGYSGPYSYKTEKQMEIKTSGYQRRGEKNAIMILSATKLPSSSWAKTLNGQMVVDKDGQFVGFADIDARREVQIQVLSALSPSVKEDLKKHFYGHEKFDPQEEMPLERSQELPSLTCKNSYAECELVEKKKA